MVVRDRHAMIAGMAPRLDPRTWVFCTTTDERMASEATPQALATFHEDEGLTLILALEDAEHLGFDTTHPMARITLEVHSALDGVGLTAAVAEALAEHNIPCNMLAAYHHDHAFVPKEMATQALQTLQARAESERKGG